MADGSNLSNKYQSTKKHGIHLLSHTRMVVWEPARHMCGFHVYHLVSMNEAFQQLTLDIMGLFVTFLPAKKCYSSTKHGILEWQRWGPPFCKVVQNMMPFLPRVLGWEVWDARPQAPEIVSIFRLSPQKKTQKNSKECGIPYDHYHNDILVLWSAIQGTVGSGQNNYLVKKL